MSRMLRLATLILMIYMTFLLPNLSCAQTTPGRFFLMGDGRLDIKNMKTGEEVQTSLLTPDGRLNEEGFNKVDEVFGFPTSEKGEHISPRMLFMLDYFSDLVAPGKVIEMDSGYRSPEYNSKLRDNGANAAKTSQHIDGMALDFHIEGVDGKELWELVRSKNCCGVGNYGGSTIHLDSARPRFWEAATSKVRTGESDYNRRLYLSTDYDRYGPGETVRLSLSSLSNFGFGIEPVVSVVKSSEDHSPVATARITAQDGADCHMIPDRKASRFITFTLPPSLREGRYRIRINFCRRPFEQMPLSTVSNEIELMGHAP